MPCFEVGNCHVLNLAIAKTQADYQLVKGSLKIWGKKAHFAKFAMWISFWPEKV